jgi:hypothetical protein
MLIQNFFTDIPGQLVALILKRLQLQRGIHQTELNTQIQKENAPFAVGHYGGSLNLDGSGLCEI